MLAWRGSFWVMWSWMKVKRFNLELKIRELQ